MFTYKDLEVWQKGMQLVERCYALSANFPRSEAYGLGSQLRRAAISIPANIAEGHCRRTTKALMYHVSIAIGSHGELETYIELGARLNLLSTNDRQSVLDLTESVGRLLNGLYRALSHKSAASSPRMRSSSD